MYKEDRRFERPENDDVKIWRYMDLPGFVWMLNQKSLYFCAIEQLRCLNPFEGSFQPSKLLKAVPVTQAQDFVKKVESCGPRRAVNCWHINESESAAMWKIYASDNKGIAIQSTFKRLVASISSFSDSVYIGKVRYIDYQEETFKGNLEEIFEPVMTKPKWFEYEKELRAVVWETSESTMRTCDGSVIVPVDLVKLIETVHLSPVLPSLIQDTLISIPEKFGVCISVRRSQLSQEPLY